MTLGVCAECGFDPGSATPETVVPQLRRWVGAYPSMVDGQEPERLHRRGAGLAWSATEYIGHVRDVMALFTDRVRLVLATDRPDLPVVDHDAAVDTGRYRDEDAGVLLRDLGHETDGLCRVLAGVRDEQWARVGQRAGDERSVLEIAQRAVHEARHHLLDIERLLGPSERPLAGAIAPPVEE